MTISTAARDAVLRVGEVMGVDGRRIYVLVDKKKNVSHMFLDGDVITNIAVNSYIAIRKGFLTIVGRVEGERIEEDARRGPDDQREPTDRNRRILTVALTGYIDERGAFTGGTRELPLVGNEAFLLTRQQLYRIHDLVRGGDLSVSVGTLYGDDIEVRLPIDGLFNSHIAIFGNTGSGKSNTLAFLYQELVAALSARNRERFESNARFLLFDFNGEYTKESCITTNKAVYSLSTHGNDGDKLPIEPAGLLDVEVLSILADATDKTQKPFLVRSVRLLERIRIADNPAAYFRGILRQRAKAVLQMSEKVRAPADGRLSSGAAAAGGRRRARGD
jgi:DNA helicase HerA-like ATPase